MRKPLLKSHRFASRIWCYLFFSITFYGLSAQQELSDSGFAKIQRTFLNRQLNTQYSECYKSISEVTWVTPPFCDAFGPRYYVFTFKLQPYFMILSAKWSRVAIAFEPRVSARVMFGKSAPVRTPSYNPGVTAYVRLLNDTTHLLYFNGSFFHHSNGQDGPTLDSGSLVEPMRMNKYNGSFATNYYTAGLNYSQAFTTPKMTYQTNSRIEIEHHIIGIDEGMKHRYGRVRLNVRFATIGMGQYVERIKIGKRRNAVLREDKLVEMFRLTFAATFILDKFTGPQSNTFGRRINLELTAMYRIPGSPDISVLLAGGYYGQDPYNIYMYDRYGFMRIGIASGFFVYRLFPDRIKVPKNRKELKLKSGFVGVEEKKK